MNEFNWKNTKHTGRAATYVVAASDASVQVKAQADYVCDGTADDVQIQAAIAALPAAGGKVLLSEGTFTTAATIVPVAYLHLEGMGAGQENEGGTIIKSVAAGTHDLIGNTAPGTPIDWIRVTGLTLDGNQANCPSGGHGIVLTGTRRFSIQGVYIKNCNGNGIHGSNLVGGYLNQWHIIQDVNVWFCNGYGIWLAGTGFVMSNISSDGNGKNGFYFQGELFDVDTIYAGGNGLTGATSTLAGISIVAVTRGRFVKPYSEHNAGHGFYVDASADCSFISPMSFSNDLGWAGQNHEFMVNACQEITIESPLIEGDIAGVGLAATGTPTNIRVLGGHIHMPTGTSYAIFHTGGEHCFTNVSLVASTAIEHPSASGTVIFSGCPGYLAPGESRIVSGPLVATDYTFTTVTGTFTETGTQLKPGANTLHCTADGTCKIDIPTGCVAVAASVGGGASVTGSPATLVTDTAFAVTAGGTNEFTITITHFAFSWQNPHAQAILIDEVLVDPTTAGGTATAVLDVGTAADATTASSDLINDLDINATTIGASTARLKLAANGGATDYITGNIITEKADSLVGKWYVKYRGV